MWKAAPERAQASMCAFLSTTDEPLRAPYLMQSAAAIERQLPANTTIAVTYANSHGLHLPKSADINAPLLGSFDPQVPGSGVFPLNRPGPVFLVQSAGLYNQRPDDYKH